jgi:serine phosphatase RsbU (regulator of sigma subunit)
VGLLLLVLGLKINYAYAQILISDDFETKLNISASSFYLEDKSRQLNFAQITLDSIQNLFHSVGIADKTLGFTRSAFWVKIPIRYSGKSGKTVILEAGRPITNLVTFWVKEKSGRWNFASIGDALPQTEKRLFHRSNVFKFRLNPGQDNTVYVRLVSDGEALNLNLNLYTPLSFWQKDYYEQLFFGLFFGVMVFALFSNLFFYFTLKESSYLWYVLYVLSITLLQFALEGLAAQYLFSFSTDLANRSVLLLAATTVFFVLLYTRKFLELEKLKNRMAAKIYTIGIWATIVITAFSFTNGFLYEIAFPLVNGLALLSMLVILLGMYFTKKEGNKINPFFYLAIVSLFLGSVIFISTNLNVLPVNFLTAHSMKFGAGFEIAFLSFSMAGKYGRLQKEKEQAQKDAFEKLQEINKLTDGINIRLENEVDQRTSQLFQQKILLEQTNKEIIDSINYAATLQRSVLPNLNFLAENLKDSFIYYRPKDIVSGDFYWFARHNDVVYLAIADCTGHGVPGAFMSMLGIDVFNRLLQGEEAPQVNDMLEQLDLEVSRILEGNSSLEMHEHGMDVALCALSDNGTKLEFAGAGRPLYLLRNNEGEPEFQKYPSNKRSIGSVRSRQIPFQKTIIEIKANDWIYMLSDGYCDQFGGHKNKKMLRKTFQILLEIACLTPGEQQRAFFELFFEKWKADLEQVDDVLVLGIKI